jgi:uncharacterized membrane protein
MKASLLLAPLLLAACSAPPPPAPPAPIEPMAPAAPTPPASTAAPVASAPLHSFRALGTEPFWHLDVDGNAIVYTTPDNQAGLALAGTRSASGDGVDIRGTHDGQAFVLRVRQGDCSDGMSDNRYPMTAEFEIGGELLKGCADGDD